MKNVRKVLLVVFAGIIAVAGWKLWSIRAEYEAGEVLYETVAEDVVTIPEELEDFVVQNPEAPAEPEEEKIYIGRPPAVNFEKLWKTNGDVVAWIYAPGTAINYPVVQGTDNEYYLKRMLDGRSNGAGTIFMDFRNEADMSDFNTILYGHNMKNGSIFGYLTRYRNQGWYDTHPVMWLVTPGETYRIDVLAGRTVEADDDAYIIYNSEETFGAWLEDFVSKSDFRSETAVEDAAQVIALSTCTYTYDDARYVLVGALSPYTEETLP